jgi:hypothetical protein
MTTITGRKFRGVILIILTGFLGAMSGCGEAAEPPQVGTEKFEADKKASQDARAKEYGRGMFDEAKGKAKSK